MKKNIHPQYEEISITCSCGHVFTISSTLKSNIKIDTCNDCHPFYTGDKRQISKGGKVDQFKARYSNFPLSSS